MNIDLLFDFDEEIANEFHKRPCPSCGGKLNWSNYHRKPRGASGTDKKFTLRFSLCCGQDGCRKRVAVPSIRFFGRRIYNSRTFLIISYLLKEMSIKRVNKLCSYFGITPNTVKSWKKWWSNDFMKSKQSKVLKGRLIFNSSGGYIPSFIYKNLNSSIYGKLYSFQKLFLYFPSWEIQIIYWLMFLRKRLKLTFFS